MPSSRGSSPPWGWTQVSCIAGWFFTYWATRETWVLHFILFINTFYTFYKCCYFNQNVLNPLPNNPSLGSSWIFFLNETFDISPLAFICYRSQMWLNKTDNKRLTLYVLSLNHLTPRCTIIAILYQTNRFKEINQHVQSNTASKVTEPERRYLFILYCIPSLWLKSA